MEREGVDFDAAVGQVARRTVFTTHTPVPAGHDRFPTDLVDEHLAPLRDALGISHERLMSLGRVNPDDAGEEFCMTVLGLRVSRRANAVSSLHGHVTRHMWTGLWGDRSEEDVPIGHITNGIHVPSWLAPQMQQLYDRHLPSELSREDALPEISAGIENVSDGALWETHVALKIRLLDYVRRQVLRDAARRGEPAVVLEQLSHALSQDALTIGFARRVATYKRASLFLQDPDRLASLVNDPQRPIQFVIAGKAHPRDEPAKGVLRQIHELSRDSRFLGKLVFLEDYDISLGRPARAGRRRVAQQSPPAAGSVRHQWAEGTVERRFEPLDPGRLVGGGLRRHERLRDRHRRSAHVTGRARPARCRGVAAGPRGRSSPALLRPRPGRRAACVDDTHEAGDPHSRLAVQRRPDGDGLRAALLPAGRRRPVERHATAISGGSFRDGGERGA